MKYYNVVVNISQNNTTIYGVIINLSALSYFVGGGSLRWIVKKHLHLDGLISAQGDRTTGYWQGAGSGGALLFEVTNMTGLSLKSKILKRFEIIIVIINVYTGLLVQDKYPVIIQGPVKQKC